MDISPASLLLTPLLALNDPDSGCWVVLKGPNPRIVLGTKRKSGAIPPGYALLLFEVRLLVGSNQVPAFLSKSARYPLL